ncbi:MAG TPA: methytransferase partner Trm112 [Thermoplasmata archaeon]|nr:methytransferase partner Trm112 [Thermoplasmata archaeon]
MRPDLMEILRCPLCRGELALSVEKREAGEIVEGMLTCGKCHVDYPIREGIPDLLPPDERD